MIPRKNDIQCRIVWRGCGTGLRYRHTSARLTQSCRHIAWTATALSAAPPYPRMWQQPWNLPKNQPHNQNPSRSRGAVVFRATWIRIHISIHVFILYLYIYIYKYIYISRSLPLFNSCFEYTYLSLSFSLFWYMNKNTYNYTPQASPHDPRKRRWSGSWCGCRCCRVCAARKGPLRAPRH